MSHKVVTERMVYMVTEYEFYEELKDAVENGLRNDIENLSVRIIERREFEKQTSNSALQCCVVQWSN